MSYKNKLVRDNVAGFLKNKGFEVKGKILKGKQYIIELYSLFLQSFKDSMQAGPNQARLAYVDMLESLRTLMLKVKVDVTKLKSDENKSLNWYKNDMDFEQKLYNARASLLEKFYELLQMRTEAVKDQLIEIFEDFKNLIRAHGFVFAKMEEIRRLVYKKLGGFGKGVYLEGISKVVTVN